MNACPGLNRAPARLAAWGDGRGREGERGREESADRYAAEEQFDDDGG